MAKEFQICGLGNAVVDIFLEVSEEEFNSLGFKKGGMSLVEQSEQKDLLARYQAHDPTLVSGGSVANSIIAFSQLGGKAAFIGCVGDDRYGLFYSGEMEDLGIEIGNPIIVNESTGTCLCLITPDAERTMRTSLAVSSHLAEKHVSSGRVSASEWLFIEGYVFANPDTGQTAIREAIRIAKDAGTKIAVTCSDAFVVEVFGDALKDALKDTDLLFCNETEAAALSGTDNAKDAFAKLTETIPSVIVTNGPNGAYVKHGDVNAHVDAFETTPKDLTGAGDMFAGSFMYGITNGVAPDKAARAASFLSHKVISQVGARLHHGTREFWDDCLKSGK